MRGTVQSGGDVAGWRAGLPWGFTAGLQEKKYYLNARRWRHAALTTPSVRQQPMAG